MELVVADHDTGTRLITVIGRLDAPGVERGEHRFAAAAGAGDRHALVDLSQVPFVGSLGLRMLISVARGMQRRGRQMVLFGVDPLVQSIFDNVALADLIPIAPDRDQAAKLLG
jgi:anti-anti-sigma factor